MTRHPHRAADRDEYEAGRKHIEPGGLELLEYGLVVGADPLRGDATLVIEGVDVG